VIAISSVDDLNAHHEQLVAGADVVLDLKGCEPLCVGRASLALTEEKEGMLLGRRRECCFYFVDTRARLVRISFVLS
jgi:hypothetical protein